MKRNSFTILILIFASFLLHNELWGGPPLSTTSDELQRQFCTKLLGRLSPTKYSSEKQGRVLEDVRRVAVKVRNLSSNADVDGHLQSTLVALEELPRAKAPTFLVLAERHVGAEVILEMKDQFIESLYWVDPTRVQAQGIRAVRFLFSGATLLLIGVAGNIMIPISQVLMQPTPGLITIKVLSYSVIAVGLGAGFKGWKLHKKIVAPELPPLHVAKSQFMANVVNDLTRMPETLAATENVALYLSERFKIPSDQATDLFRSAQFGGMKNEIDRWIHEKDEVTVIMDYLYDYKEGEPVLTTLIRLEQL